MDQYRSREVEGLSPAAELIAGTTLGPYQILCLIGSGGMGTVYKARDPRVDRTVAIKVAADRFSSRFGGEARAVAALNHPHICTLYDVGENYLVMEYVEGRPLQGPLPLDEALRLAIQLAGALDAAHRKGIVHRDLKPGNILVTKSGVKVLDFGLAKMENAPVAPEAPTVTEQGVIVGTLHYMSPEQVQGKEVDPRSDIFSFGLVLNEMLTGRRVIEGDNAASVIAAILTAPAPPVSPPAVDRVLRRCLAKDPEERWQTARDLKAELEWLAGPAGALGTGCPTEAPATPRALAWGWLAAAVLATALASLAVIHLRETPPEAPVIRSTILPPETATLAVQNRGGPALSPDGRRLAFRATLPDGRSQLWVRSLDTLTAHPLPGTDGAAAPFWSPDGKSIGFFSYTESRIITMDVAGGPQTTLAEAPEPWGASWSPEGIILYARSPAEPLHRVPAAGGASAPATKLDSGRAEFTHFWPWFLPDGKHFLYSVSSSAGLGTIRLGSLDSQESRMLLEAGTGAVYSQGYLLFDRGATLMAQAFDLKALATRGPAFPIAEQVRTTSLEFSASAGLLVYQPGADRMRLAWFDRSGRRLSSVGDPANFGRLHLSPDRKNAAVAVTSGDSQDLWVYDTARGLRTRFTFAPDRAMEAVWTPDGRSIVFGSNRNGSSSSGLYRKSSDGTGNEELLYADGILKYPQSVSPDGKFLIYSTAGDPLSGQDLWILPMTPQTAPLKPLPLLHTVFTEFNGQFSPDGRWIAYQSNEAGRGDVYVMPFRPPGTVGGGRRRISPAGGIQPRWRRDGKELFFVAPDQRLNAAEINLKGDTVEVGTVRPLFGPLPVGKGYLYDVSADGRQFLVVAAPEDDVAGRLTLVQNWTAGLKK